MVDASFEIGRRRFIGGIAASGVTLALGARAADAPPVRLSLNENPFGPSSLAIQAIQAGLGGLARYADVEASELVAAIAAREHVAEDQIVLGEVLEPLGRLLARQGDPGGEIIYSSPGYTALVDAARLDGGVGVPVPLDARLENDLGALSRALGPRTRALFLVNPHNPSGTVSRSAEFHDVVARAARVAWVIVDEAYIEYTPDHAQRSVVKLARPDARVIVFRTFTKFYGLGGLPLGYAILPSALARALRYQGLGAPRSLSRLALLAARASLADPAYAERVRRQVADERARWFQVLDALGLRRSHAVASFVFFHAGRPQPKLAAAFAERGLDIGRAFPPLDDWARISIGLPEDNARAQKALREILAG